ncbi:BON domain-containing protein [Armatimonas rosea]|uniref:Osmotically-inducible protein OsmY n=1 Tax=Armatimonas rosea TaxID=685828 RepID=A0A7W9W9I5_ARMRO|nr:BON domain-containing protein [Armatimonas rosea]MBB6053250.1 osmotically-inducible protein OsmY [Armatimonas rosea]
MIHTENILRHSIGATLALLTLGMVSGCKNTGEGMSKDTEIAKQSASAETEKAGENAAKMANSAGEIAKGAGQNVTGALEVTPLIKTAITADTELNDAKNKIDIDTKDGIVHIKGHVSSNALKAKATKIATEKIKENQGTDKVMNQLLVQP